MRVPTELCGMKKARGSIWITIEPHDHANSHAIAFFNINKRIKVAARRMIALRLCHERASQPGRIHRAGPRCRAARLEIELRLDPAGAARRGKRR